MVCHISSTTVTSRLHMISSDTGSASISAAAWAIGVSAVMRAAAGGGQADLDAQACRWHPRVTVSPGSDDRGGLAFLDDGGAGDHRAAASARSGHRPASRRSRRRTRPVACPCSAAPDAPAPACGQRQRRQRPAATDAERDRLHADAAIDRGVARRIGGREGGADRRQRSPRDRAVGQRHVDFVHLADQPHVGRAFDHDVARARRRPRSGAPASPASRSRSAASMTAAASGASSRSGWLRTCSNDSGAARKPSAEAAPRPAGSALPARRGRARLRPRGPVRRRRSRPWRSARGSLPFSTMWMRAAAAMFSVTSAMDAPGGARSRTGRACAPTRASARSAASRSSAMRPPRKKPGS